MCSFADSHRDVIEMFTAEKEHNLRKYHLTLREWDIVEQLCCVLKVSLSFSLSFMTSLTYSLGSEGCDTILLSFRP